MKVENVMKKDLVLAQEDMSVLQVAELMLGSDVSSVPVVDSKKNILGVIIEDDLIVGGSHIHLPTYMSLLDHLHISEKTGEGIRSHVEHIEKLSVKDIMRSDFETVSKEDDIQKVIKIFANGTIPSVFVVGKDGNVEGVVSKTDIIKLFAVNK